MEIIQQFNQLLHPYILEYLGTSSPSETYSKSPQPWGEWNQVAKADKVSCTNANHFTWRMSGGPSIEKICDRFAVPTLENHVDQPPVVFGVSERDVSGRLPIVEVTKTKFQTVEEKALPALKIFAVLTYRRAPFVRKYCQTRGSNF